MFAQSRLSTEILTTYLKDDFDGAPGAPERIRGYRGGYLPKRRREIEKGLREGAVRAVVSTNALELGIDIGALDVAVMAGYPGTIAATWQRAGRAGRRAGRSAAVMVASSAPLDQFVVRNPSYFFDASPEHALIDPDNLHILVDHIKCAAFELPFTAQRAFGRDDVQEILAVLAEEGLVHRVGATSDGEAQWNWTSESYPADAVSLRSISSDNFVVVDTTREPRVIGETDFTSGPSTLHPKAIYIVEGTLYQVERLDFEGRKAFVREIDCDYYTDAITYTRVTILDTFADQMRRPAGESSRGAASHGEVHVVSRVVGFKKIKFYTNENVGSGELDLPEQQMHTTSYWLTIPRERDGGAAVRRRRSARRRRRPVVRDAAGGAAAADVRSPRHRHLDRHRRRRSTAGDPAAAAATCDEPRIFIYDNYPGGIGFSEPLFRMHDAAARRHARADRECECEHGCPGCVGPIGDTGPLAKPVALRILDRLLTPALSRHDHEPRSPPARDHARRRRSDAPSPAHRERRGCARHRIVAGVASAARAAARARDATPQSVGRRLAQRLPRALGGACTNGGGSVRRRRSLLRRDHLHGLLRIGDVRVPRRTTTRPVSRCSPARRAMPALPRLGARAAREPHGDFVFLDLETTGLAGGAGTYAFLVGCGWFEAGAFRVRQFFMVGHALERALLAAVRERLERCGRAGQLQRQVVRRAACSRRGSSSTAAAAVRRLPARRHAAPGAAVLAGSAAAREPRRARSRELHAVALERALLGVQRTGDVPGFEIPTRYFDFLRSGDASPLEPVLEHNRLDLLSLAALTARALPAARRGRIRRCDGPRESLGVAGCSSGRRCATAPRRATAARIDLAARSWQRRRRGRARRGAARLALRCRRDAHGTSDAAAALGDARRAPAGCPPALMREALEALAIHHEHRVARPRAGAPLRASRRGASAAHTRHRPAARADRSQDRASARTG